MRVRIRKGITVVTVIFLFFIGGFALGKRDRYEPLYRGRGTAGASQDRNIRNIEKSLIKCKKPVCVK